MNFLTIPIIFNVLVLVIAQKEGTFDSSSPVESASLQYDVPQETNTVGSNSLIYAPRTVPKVATQCGAACPKTCKNPNPRLCPMICAPGYICPTGRYENSAGECVVLNDCSNDVEATTQPPRHLPGHIIWRPRPIPSRRPRRTTTTPIPPYRCENEWDSDNFISPSDPVPNQSRYAEKVYSDCGSSCPATCHDPNPTCIAVCKSGMFCPRGYILDSFGRCIDSRYC